MENEKEKIRFLYTELQGCLTQAPDKTDWVSDKSIWERYNDSDEQTPFREMPHTIISQTQQQNLAVFFRWFLNFRIKLNRAWKSFQMVARKKLFYKN